jgi:hypothetical protein
LDDSNGHNLAGYLIFETKPAMTESNYQMFSRFARIFLAVGLLVALWGMSLARRPDGHVWVRPLDAHPGPVRILRFYASVGSLSPGQSAQLCYSVENARMVRISPMQSAWPAQDRCFDVVPEHTTHYTLLAEGFDGTVAARSFTLSVQRLPAARPSALQYAVRRRTTTRSHSRTNS